MNAEMQSPAEILASALNGRECRLTRREADWNFNFGERINIAAPLPWRVVTADGIAHGNEDEGQYFGLAAPVDGENRTNELLGDQKVLSVELDALTGDLRLVFDGGTRIDFCNMSSGYEGWTATVPLDGKQVEIIALGGGGLATL